MAKKKDDLVPAGMPAATSAMDPKELKEREEAAKAYAGENEKHFVDYNRECVKLSVDSMLPIRAMQRECWSVYNEEEPPNYATKEPWQNRITYPKPFRLVQEGTAIVRKIFDTDFLSVEQKGKDKDADFWRDLLLVQLGRNYANFSLAFSDATTMALGIGQSDEMIPYWVPGRGLRIARTEPGKIHRDPDALSREPQSGEFWIHEEYLYYHHLLEMQKLGRYQNIKEIGAMRANPQLDSNITLEEMARRKQMLYQRSKFHHAILTYEFWGTVVGPNYEMLLPNATFTVAADRVISPPKPSPYENLRWPGVSFSAIPNVRRFDGRGLIEGIRSLWYLMCNLTSLHADHLNWIVNPMMEIDTLSLWDQSDIDRFPGKAWLTGGTAQGQQAVRTVDFRSEVGDMMAILNFYDQRHQDGGMIDYKAMGLPGYRAEVTKGEAAQDLEQSMVLTAAMARNVEDGALHFVYAAAETIRTFMTYDELKQIMGAEVADRYRDEESPTKLNLPPIGTGTLHVSGISGVMKDQEILRHLMEMMPMYTTANSVFLPYLEPYYYLRALEKRAYLKDEMLLISEERADAIMQAQQAQQEKQIATQAGMDQAATDTKAAEAAKWAAAAEKFKGEAAAKTAQAGLYNAQAAAQGAPGVAPAEAGGGEAVPLLAEEGVPPAGIPPGAPPIAPEEVAPEGGLQ